MKKIALLLAGLMILAGCGAATEEPTEEVTTEVTVVTEEVVTPDVEVVAEEDLTEEVAVEEAMEE